MKLHTIFIDSIVPDMEDLGFIVTVLSWTQFQGSPNKDHRVDEGDQNYDVCWLLPDENINHFDWSTINSLSLVKTINFLPLNN